MSYASKYFSHFIYGMNIGGNFTFIGYEKDWICNKRVLCHAAGQEYISKKGKHVPAKKMKPPCSCRLKCYE